MTSSLGKTHEGHRIPYALHVTRASIHTVPPSSIKNAFRYRAPLSRERGEETERMWRGRRRTEGGREVGNASPLRGTSQKWIGEGGGRGRRGGGKQQLGGRKEWKEARKKWSSSV